MKLFLLLLSFLIGGLVVQAQVSGADSVPVRLSTLDARSNGNDARLDWKVVCFLDYAKFEIQRSADGSNYTTINIFEADYLRCRQPLTIPMQILTVKLFTG